MSGPIARVASMSRAHVWVVALVTAAAAGSGCDCAAGGDPDRARAEDRGQWPGYELVRSLGGSGTKPGRFDTPLGLAVGGHALYVADTGNGRVQKLSLDGRDARVLGGQDAFVRPMDVEIAKGGHLWVADFGADRLRCIRPGGEVCRRNDVHLEAPAGIGIEPDGTLAAALFFGHRVVLRSGKDRLAIGGKGSGPSQFRFPTDVAMTAGGSLLVVDTYNHRVKRLDGRGRIRDVWPGPPGAEFQVPSGIAREQGVTHVADGGGHRIVALDARGELLSSWTLPEDERGDVNSPVRVAAAGNHVYALDAARDRILVLRAKAKGRKARSATRTGARAPLEARGGPLPYFRDLISW